MSASSIFLTDDELRDVTHRRNPSAQIRALERIGAPWRRRPDGTLIVGRLALEKALSGEIMPSAEAANGLAWN